MGAIQPQTGCIDVFVLPNWTLERTQGDSCQLIASCSPVNNLLVNCVKEADGFSLLAEPTQRFLEEFLKV